MRRFYSLLIIFLILGTSIARAQKPPTNILNFEEDVIQGERKSPNLFIQLDVGKPNLDTVLFLRNNFNDYHIVDKDRRPSYRKLK